MASSFLSLTIRSAAPISRLRRHAAASLRRPRWRWELIHRQLDADSPQLNHRNLLALTFLLDRASRSATLDTAEALARSIVIALRTLAFNARAEAIRLICTLTGSKNRTIVPLEMGTQTLEHLSDLLARTCGTEYVGVWSCALDRLDLCYGRSKQAHVNAAHAAWREARFELQEGRKVRERDCTVLPLLSGRHDLVGLVVLPVAVPKDEPSARCVDELLRRITRHVMCPQMSPEPEMLSVPVDLLAAPGGIECFEREAYAAVMLRFGWNVSLVAALLGVSRVRLLRRLKRVGLERPNTSTMTRPRGASTAGAEPIDDALRALLWPRAGRRRLA